MLEEFIKDLKHAAMTEADILNKYIFSGNPFIFGANVGLHSQLKTEIAKQFNVSITDVHMVGSAKLGFSISPDQLWKPFDDESDIDMVIISENVFTQLWEDLSNLSHMSYNTTEQEQRKFQSFLKYFFRGWIRPDFLPQTNQTLITWEDSFKIISYKKYGAYKIKGAVFKNEFFFRKYHEKNLKIIREGL